MNSQRLWGVALGVSLTVNAFCIAALLTSVFALRDPPAQRQGLPPEARALFRAIDPRQQPGFDASIRRLRQHREDVRNALVAQPFDAAALAEAFARLRETEAEKAAHAHRKVAEVAARLSPEQRRQLAEFVGRRPGRRGPGEGRHPRPPHPL